MTPPNDVTRFAHGDYAQFSGLRPWLVLKLFIRGYDINCQYDKKFLQRFETMKSLFPELQTIPKCDWPFTLAAIGKFHVGAHTERCRYLHSYNYLPGVGITDGEAPKRVWAVMNSLARRTKEMMSGHRHDVLNDAFGDFNVRRVHAMRE